MLAAGLIALALSRRAAAEQERRQYVDITARATLFTVATTDESIIGGLIGFAIDYRITPAWRVGAFTDLSGARVQSSDQRCDHTLCDFYDFGAFRFGPRAEWHARPQHVVDPWFGASLGLFNPSLAASLFDRVHEGDKREWGADAEIDVGLDIHIGRIFTIGPSLFIIVPFINRDAGGFPIRLFYSGGLPFSELPPGIPPALRIAVSI